MKRSRLIALLLAAAVIACFLIPGVGAAFAPSENTAYQSIIAMQAQYPEGMRWTNDNFYAWKGGVFSGGFGCAGFAFLLSDTAFGDLPARVIEDYTYEEIRVGDILRINGNSHSVVILEKHSDWVVLAEGNFNSSIHWGRTLTRAQVMNGDYLMTRYPEGDVQYFDPDTTVEPFTDVLASAYYAEPVQWAVNQGITQGTSGWTFSPKDGCTRAQVVTFLWRYAGAPAVSGIKNPFTDVKQGSYYYDAVLWAVENGITQGTSATRFSPSETCTRAQVVTFLWRMCGQPPYWAADSFDDVSENDYFYDSVSWASVNEITSGTSYDTFSPYATCTRAQVVTFLFRYNHYMDVRVVDWDMDWDLEDLYW